ncbi:hypothetical protein GH714_006029 [Hevea brasiliensis]|uniref:Chloride channel protein n=1 Tax=Hevea brasiliensis TaxID=3981 RepID=A0A6A6L0Z7_HEVBR|nr:hypothetical protein GH714_006029 [Hevea brasiliensis]
MIVTPVQIFGSILGVAAGFVVGKEGPMVRAGVKRLHRILLDWKMWAIWARRSMPTEGHYGHYNTFQSPPNHYNTFRNLLTSSTKKKFKLITLLVFFVATCVLGIITYTIAIPSGLFIPVILAGASYGRLVGNLLGPLSCLDVSPFALLGAASFLGGTMRMTVSVCVILLELTNDLLMLPSVMLVLLISKIADRFNKGVHDQIVKLKGLPYMEMHAEP